MSFICLFDKQSIIDFQAKVASSQQFYHNEGKHNSQTNNDNRLKRLLP